MIFVRLRFLRYEVLILLPIRHKTQLPLAGSVTNDETRNVNVFLALIIEEFFWEEKRFAAEIEVENCR